MVPSDGLTEVSDGTIELPLEQRVEAIRLAREQGFTVITEVGKKEAGLPLAPEEALRLIHADLEAGAVKVILEGRESGKGAGLYKADGQIRTEELEQIASGLAADPSVLMWEAPLKSQQEALIRRFGTDVSLGNIPPGDVLALEALRRGLRGDTLRLALDRSSVIP